MYRATIYVEKLKFQDFLQMVDFLIAGHMFYLEKSVVQHLS